MRICSVPACAAPSFGFESLLSDNAVLLQPLLLVMALAAVPVMLLVKPLILKKRHEARHTIAVRIIGFTTFHYCFVVHRQVKCYFLHFS